MAKGRMGIIALLLCVCTVLLPCTAYAVSTTDAKEPIAPDAECSLSVLYQYDQTPFPSLPVRLYRIADVSSDFQYTLTEQFADTGLILNGIKSTGEWNIVRDTLEAYIVADGIEADRTELTDSGGLASFMKLKTGMYLAIADGVETDDASYAFESALISIPSLDDEGEWHYRVNATAKPEALPPINPDGTVEMKIVKLWQGDKGTSARPDSVEIEIFRGGESYDTVTLSEDNNWSYSWSSVEDGAEWTVIERSLPRGYTSTVEKRDGTFVITNVYGSENPPDSPETGDTSNILLYLILMNVSGVTLIILGITGKRKRDEET